MKFTNLENLRNHAGKTLEDVASKLGVSKSTISNWEKDPENVPIIKLEEYAKAINYQFEDLVLKEISETKTDLNVKCNEELMVIRKKLKNSIKEFSDYANSIKDYLILGNNNILVSILNNINNLQVEIRKPRVALVGESDTGKSTFINYILGQGNILPARWTPATGSVIKIAHTDDKPSWLVGNTVVIRSEKDNLVEETWNLSDSKYDNEKYFKEHVVEQGSRDLISSFGDRDGHKFKNSQEYIYTIYTFLDSEILKTIEIWDTPGIGAGDDKDGESDESLSLYAQTNADMLIYFSVINQFLHASDVAYLRQPLKRIDKSLDFNEGLPAWHNLFIVASQAHIIDDSHECENVLNKGSKRLLNQFGEDFLNEYEGYSAEAFRSRFFTFSKEDISYRTDLENAFNTIFEKESNIILSNFKTLLNKFNNTSQELLNNGIKEYQELLIEKKRIFEELEEATNNLQDVLKANSDIERDLKIASNKGRADSKSAFNEFYSKNMSEDQILTWIDSQDVKNKKESKKNFSTWLSGKLQDELEAVLKKNSEQFKHEFDKIGGNIQKNSKIDVNSFDFTSVMAGLVTSGIVGGAFAIVAAGISSNLGLYILVAQVGGLLTSIGVISSPIVLTSFVASTLGPVGWVIGLSILSGVAISWIFRSSAWKKKFAKQILKAYSKENALEKFINASDTYWNNTDESIDKLKESMDLVAKENIRILEDKSKSNDVDLNLGINQLANLCYLLESFNIDNVQLKLSM